MNSHFSKYLILCYDVFLDFSGRFCHNHLSGGYLHFGTGKAHFVPISAQSGAFSAISWRWRATFPSLQGRSG
jgi:hypothetical protein